MSAVHSWARASNCTADVSCCHPSKEKAYTPNLSLLSSPGHPGPSVTMSPVSVGTHYYISENPSCTGTPMSLSLLSFLSGGRRTCICKPIQKGPSPALWPGISASIFQVQCLAWHEHEPILGEKAEEVPLDTL